MGESSRVLEVCRSKTLTQFSLEKGCSILRQVEDLVLPEQKRMKFLMSNEVDGSLNEKQYILELKLHHGK